MNLLGLGLVGFAAVLLLILRLRKTRSTPKLRTIPALTRLYRSIGLSVEDGTRLLIGLGAANPLSKNAAAGLAGLSLLRHLTERTSISDRPPVAVSGDASLAILSQDTLQAGYAAAGTTEFYQPAAGRLAGLTGFSSAVGTMSILRDENVSASILIGHYGVEGALLADAAERANTVLVGATDDPAGQAALYASAPETLLGEELFAAGAYLEGSATRAASLTAQDILRWLIIISLLAGAGLKLFGLI
jgi:hypothetical protein